ncbi:MAG: hypothetical protein ACRBB0_04180 [Pelagimonas sp.]|uniref:hypothetical protein n=1 Tax=Pelagimonas sp. TaxID=2073170 RepID=UPI003D6B04C4
MTVFSADRATYIKTHKIMGVVAMALGFGVLWIAGNPHAWTGLVGGAAAVALRGWYLSDEELGHRWVMENGVLSGPAERRIFLSDVVKVKSIGSAVQLITTAGDKHLIKFQEDPQATINAINAARSASGETT